MASVAEELSLHYSLTQTGDSQNSENKDIETNENSNQSNDSLDTNDSSNDDNKINQEPEQNGDDYFDPFAVEDNNKKFGAITLKQEVDKDDDDDIDIPSKSESNPKDEQNTDTNDNDEPAADENNDDIYCDDGDDDIEDEEDDEDDEELRKEMEAQFKKANKEKNQSMTSLLQSIRNKHKNPPKKQNISKPPNRKKTNDNFPSLKPFAFDGNLKIVFDPKQEKDIKQQKDKEKQQQRDHFHPVNGSKLRKNMKRDLKKQIHKKRKKDIRKYRKEFGKEEDHYNESKPRRNLPEKESKSLEPFDAQSDADENMMDKTNEAKDEEENEDSDIEEIDASKYIEDIVEAGDELDEEDLARAALMRQPEKISKEVAELMDIAAEEENENGEIITKFEDEYEEKHGIAKDLLADKAEIKLIKKHEDVYNAKRNEMHQILLNRDDDKELELMKKAFVDGDYRALQNKARGKNNIGILDDDTNDGENALKFKSRHAESNLLRNDPNYYLSDDEEKNEYCCYDKNGRFLPVDSIRMKIMEWNRNKNKENMLLEEDDEEDLEEIKQRKERVRKREMLRASSLDQIQNKHKISSDDKSAIKILQKLRNKKQRKKPGLAKANTLSTNFGAFYLEKGLTIPALQRTKSSGSFLKHREKCIERVLAESKSKTNSSSSLISNKKHFVFKQQPNSKKRKRDNNYMNNSNSFKKRRIC